MNTLTAKPKNGNGATKERVPSRNGKTTRSLVSAKEVQALENYWQQNPRWQGVSRNYSAEKVLCLRGTVKIEHTIADRMSRKLWDLLQNEDYVNALGALSGNQAVQMVQAGLKAI